MTIIFSIIYDIHEALSYTLLCDVMIPCSNIFAKQELLPLKVSNAIFGGLNFYFLKLQSTSCNLREGRRDR